VRGNISIGGPVPLSLWYAIASVLHIFVI